MYKLIDLNRSVTWITKRKGFMTITFFFIKDRTCANVVLRPPAQICIRRAQAQLHWSMCKGTNKRRYFTSVVNVRCTVFKYGDFFVQIFPPSYVQRNGHPFVYMQITVNGKKKADLEICLNSSSEYKITRCRFEPCKATYVSDDWQYNERTNYIITMAE